MEVTLERETIDLKTASEQWFQTVLKKLRKMAGTLVSKEINKSLIYNKNYSYTK